MRGKKFKSMKEALEYYKKKNLKASIETGVKKFSSVRDAGAQLTYLLEPQKEIVIYWLLDNETFQKKKKICGAMLTFGRRTNSRCTRHAGQGTKTPKAGYCNFCRRGSDADAATRYYASEVMAPEKFSPFISMLAALEREPQGQLEILDADIRLLDATQAFLVRSQLEMSIEPGGWSSEFVNLLVTIVKEKRNLAKLRFAIDKINMLTNDDVERWLQSVRSKLNREIGEEESEKVFFSIAEASGIFDRTQFVGTSLDPLKVSDEEEERRIEETYRKIAKAHPLSHGKHQYVDFEDITPKRNGSKANGRKNGGKK